MKQAMNVPRLKRLKVVMARQDKFDTGFNMSSWASRGVPKIGRAGGPHLCGTTCCALGHAALDPVLSKQGLYLLVRANGGEHEVSSLQELVALGRIAWAEVHLADQHYGLDAAMEFFGLSCDEARYLFMPSHYPDRRVRPRHVIKHIDDVLAGKLRATR